MFALDYALWFDMLLPGLDRIGMPMPLGGTVARKKIPTPRRKYQTFATA
jgi:hypothetical protein